MKKSESIKELAEALCNLQEEIIDVPKNSTAKSISKSGKEYSRDYANLLGVVEIARPLLKKHGLSITQHPGIFRNGNVVLETLITHKSGEWIESEFEIPYIKFDGQNEPQSVGTLISYARRYVLKGIYGMADADSDAQGMASKDKNIKPQYVKAYTDQKEPPKSTDPIINDDQVKHLRMLINGDDSTNQWIKMMYNVKSATELTVSQYIEISNRIRLMDKGLTEPAPIEDVA
jgi:hypothetical protein